MTRICNNKAKFSNEQIRILECMFESESRPELQLKQQMAARLGLQARQVAIWFQNKRARSKSKLLLQEYDALKDKYDDLASKFESLNMEKQRLLNQLQKLRKLIADEQGSMSSNGTVEQSHVTTTFIHQEKEFVENTTNYSDNINIGEEVKEEEKTIILPKGNKSENPDPHRYNIDTTHENKEEHYAAAEETDLVQFSDDVVPFHHLITCETWCNLEPNLEYNNLVFDQAMSSCNSQWWDNY